MRTSVNIIMSVLLVTAVIFGIVFYQKNSKNQSMIQSQTIKIKEYQSDLVEQASQLDTLKAINEEQQDQIDYLKNENQKINELQNELEVLNSVKKEAISKSQDQIDIQEVLIEDMKIQLEGAQKTIQSLKRSENSLQSEINSIKSLFEDKNKEAEECKKNSATLLDKLNEKEEKISGLVQLEEKKNSEMSVLQDKYQRLVSEVHIIQNQMGEKDQNLTQFKAQLSNAMDEKGKLEQQTTEIKKTYEQLLTGLREEIENKEAMLQSFQKKLTLTFVDRILFDMARASISETGIEKLKKVGDILRKLESGSIRIEGHTDNVPIGRRYRSKFPTNWELSAVRAAAVVRFFIEESNLDPSRVEAVGHSYYKPIADNDTRSGRAQNRRVEISIVPE